MKNQARPNINRTYPLYLSVKRPIGRRSEPVVREKMLAAHVRDGSGISRAAAKAGKIGEMIKGRVRVGLQALTVKNCLNSR